MIKKNQKTKKDISRGPLPLVTSGYDSDWNSLEQKELLKEGLLKLLTCDEMQANWGWSS